MATLDVHSVPGGGRIALQTQRQGAGLGVVPRVGRERAAEHSWVLGAGAAPWG